MVSLAYDLYIVGMTNLSPSHHYTDNRIHYTSYASSHPVVYVFVHGNSFDSESAWGQTISSMRLLEGDFGAIIAIDLKGTRV